MLRISAKDGRWDLLNEVEEISGQNLYACYQCGKCAAGCPLSFGMDLLPYQVIRLLQLGQGQAALEAKSIWLCVGCLTCATRCPKAVDPARVMEALRTILLRSGQVPAGMVLLPADVIAQVPQQASVAALRKLTL